MIFYIFLYNLDVIGIIVIKDGFIICLGKDVYLIY
jgi:hypothetical protein